MSKRILIIEDEESIAELERDYLELSNFEVEVANDGQLGLDKALGEEFDLIIIDTPPMGIGADATIVGRQSDGVLLVVRNNFVSKKSVKKVKDGLVRTGSKIVGVVLNRIDKHQTDYYNYYGYYYY